MRAKVSLNMMQLDDFNLNEALENEKFVISNVTTSKNNSIKLF